MFREVARKKQQLDKAQCVELLKTEMRGVLSLIGDDGYPYGLPIDHWYHEEDGCLYFHSGPVGHKVDAIRNCDKASFCVYDQGFRKDGDWALNIKSVIVFGHIEIVEDHAKAIELTRALSFKYTSDAAYIQEEIDKYGHEVLVFKLVPEHMTGKITKES
ncbi:MAG: pyridoxamine 5'-phosphate oxidase family protein [Oscillospiraceae bacterium]|nr:pyridoxamine 5'-phosphate oxidase family protein [Oscillospiraceae bacterium]